MNTVILYYSYSGNTKKYAQALAERTGAALCEVRDAKRRGTVGTYVMGSFVAMRGAASAIEPLKINLAEYDRIVLAGPIWASSPAPAMNAAVDLLPSGKEVELILLSGSGNGKSDRIAERIRAKGCKVLSVEHVKA